MRALSWNDISVSFASLVTSTVLSPPLHLHPPPRSSPAAASPRPRSSAFIFAEGKLQVKSISGFADEDAE